MYLLKPVMHLLETHVIRGNADTVGATDEVNLSGLSVGTYIDVCTTSHGECVVTIICPQLIGYIKSKSIFSVSRIETQMGRRPEYCDLLCICV
jgi:hypothetical protein